MLDELFKIDPEVFQALLAETKRQDENLELIASENFASEATLAAIGSPHNNKYAEGYPGERYYGGCEFMDIVENLARERVKQLFNAEHANVQPHAGSQANMAVYFAALEMGDTILSMELPCGGHLSHGAKVSFSGKLYKVIYYGVKKDTETIDFDQVAKLAQEYKPKIIVTGYSAYPRAIPWERFREIANSVGAYLMADIAHIAGLVATGYHPTPMPWAEFVTSTTHKTLRGPRGGFILCKKEWAPEIDKAVFPEMQGGPLMHSIAAKAVCFKEAQSPEFKNYQGQIVKNAKTLAETLKSEGLRLVANGTDTHLMLADVRPLGLTGRQAEDILGEVKITVNKNTIPYDPEKPRVTSGIRIGVPAVTTRGMKEQEMVKIGQLIAKVLKSIGEEKVKIEIKARVKELCAAFPLYKKRRERMEEFLKSEIRNDI